MRSKKSSYVRTGAGPQMPADQAKVSSAVMGMTFEKFEADGGSAELPSHKNVVSGPSAASSDHLGWPDLADDRQVKEDSLG